MRRNALAIAIACVSAALWAAAPVGAAGTRWLAPRGDLVVTFSGSGGGSYHFHAPAEGAGAACRAPDATYAETDSYSWSFTFVVAPSGGSGGPPAALTGVGQLTSSEQTLRCAGAPASVTTCTQALRAPSPANAGDLDYPEVNVVASARTITVGAIGELLRSSPPSCSGPGALIPNLVQGYPELQASVTFPRTLLARPDGYRGPFTMSGSGLYAGVPQSGSCSSTSCDPTNCTADLPGGAGTPGSCSFAESYSGTIEVRVIR
jgi:hypothetical protein